MFEYDLKLIEFVTLHPELYNRAYKDKNFSHIREALWKEIATQLNASPIRCRTRWKHIKDTYNRFERQKKKNLCKTDIKWPYYDRLYFLKSDQPKNTNSFENQSSDPLSDTHNEEYSSTSFNVCDDLDNDNSSNIPRKRRKYPTSESPTRAIEREDEIPPQVTPQHDDDLSSFCDYVRSVLQKFPDLQRIKAKNAIFEIIYKHELGLAANQSEHTDDYNRQYNIIEPEV